MAKDSEIRRRACHIAAEVLVLKKSIAKIEQSMRQLLSVLEMNRAEMMLACEHIDFEEFVSKLTPRAQKALEKANVFDGESLTTLTVQKLQEVPNCGETTVEQIERVLSEYGVSLPDYEPE